MNSEALHFLRPGWLYAIALVLPIGWVVLRGGTSATRNAWRRVCDPALLRALSGGRESKGRLGWLAPLALAWIAACVAMAGPTWERLPQATFVPPDQTVLALHLGRSMDARDVAPSRLARARFALQDVLQQVDGAVGLVIYAEEPYAVTPLTDDPKVIAQMLPTLRTDLMPGRGNRPDRAIDESLALLDQVDAHGGRIVLLTDGLGDDPDAALAAAARARSAGHLVSVLGFGDAASSLQPLADAGGGQFSPPLPDDADIERVLARAPDPLPATLGTLERSELHADSWRDVGGWLLLVPLLLAPLAFRRGWAASLGVLLAAGAAPPPAEAAELQDWFARKDQQGESAFVAGRHAEAASTFEDPAWRAAALYRNGDYESAAETLASLDRPESRYNLGNALARAGQLEQAVAAYDRALELAPDHEDALHNRALVQALLEQQQDQQEQDPQPSQSGQDSESDESSGDGEKSSDRDGSSDGEKSSDGDSSGDGEKSSAGANDSDGEPGDTADQSGEGSPSADAGAQGASSQSEAAETQDDDTNQESRSPGSQGSDRADDPSQKRASSPPADFQPEGSRAPTPGEPAADASADDPAGADAPEDGTGSEPATVRSSLTPQERERERAAEQWLRRVPDDPGGLLREKLRRRYAERRYGGLVGGSR